MSDWIEEADGVFRGGGVKGIGLAGALLAFAEHPDRPIKRWVNCAGASAGAIIAAYLAVKDEDAVAGLATVLSDKDFADFRDFPRDSLVFGALPNFVARHGLARGSEFESWFDGILGSATFGDVRGDDGKSQLALVAVDVTNRKLLVLPDDLAFYRRPGESQAIDPNQFRISRAARMSMSIPYFFEPVPLVRDTVRCVDPGGTDLVRGALVDRKEVEAANADALEAGAVAAEVQEVTDPPKALIIDGGTLSNFPVWIFDVNPRVDKRQPLRRTFGFTLRGGRGVAPGAANLLRYAPWPIRFGADIFHTAQSAWDTRFVSQSTRTRTVVVDALDVGTTQFTLSECKKKELLDSGRSAANEFLADPKIAEATNTFGAAPP